MELWALPVIQIKREGGKLPCSALPPAPARTPAARLARARGRWPAGQRGSAGGPTRRASAAATEQRRWWGRPWARVARGGVVAQAGQGGGAAFPAGTGQSGRGVGQCRSQGVREA